MRKTLLCALIALVAQTGCGEVAVEIRPPPPDSEILHQAVSDVTRVIVFDIFSPPQASRLYAYASVAAYEAVRHADPRYRSLAGQLNELDEVPVPTAGAEYNYPLAGAHAFLAVARALAFSQGRVDSLRATMHERVRAAGIPDPVFDRTVAYGDAVANHVLAWAARDSFPESRGWPKYSVDGTAARWVPTPPAYMDAVEPNWGRLRPFALSSADEVPPAPALPFDMTEGSAFRREAMEVVEVGSRLTDEEVRIASFWDCNPYVMHVRGHTMVATKKITPGGHWMEIVAIAARKADTDVPRSAEAYALTAIAIADGFIGAWREKYRSAVLRPETVINAYLDEGWQPLLQTPPFPEYPSGHSVISAGAATVLTELFGEGFAFEDTAEVPYGLPVRSFASFEHAAEEAATSRLYGGIHYRAAIEEGVIQGRKIGEVVVSRLQTRLESAG